MNTQQTIVAARQTLLRRGRDLLRSAGKCKPFQSIGAVPPLTGEQRTELADIYRALKHIELGIFDSLDVHSESTAGASVPSIW